MSASTPARTARPAAKGPSARLRLSETTGSGQLDGGWWPRSQDVTAELEQLLAAVPASAGRVSRVSLSMADWPLPHPTRSVQRGLPVKVGWFSVMEPHTVTLGSSSAGAQRLLLLVVPAEATKAQAERDLVAASTPTDLRTTAVLQQAAVPAPQATATPAPRAAATAEAAGPHRPAMTRSGRTA